MALSSKLLDILVCPQCKGPLAQVESGQGLLCNKCQLKFPVRDNIPVMLVEEALSMRGEKGKGPSVITAPQNVAGLFTRFRVVGGPDQTMTFDLEKKTCRALGRAVTDPNKTSVLNVDLTLSIDSDTKGLILQYIQRQFRKPPEAKGEGLPANQLGDFRRATDVVFKDQTLSRLHAMLFYDEVGVGILDLVSKNGTFVNGEEVESRLLKKGDTIELGETKVVFEE